MVIYKQKSITNVAENIYNAMSNPSRRFTAEVATESGELVNGIGRVVKYVSGDYILTETVETTKKWICKAADFTTKFEVA